MNNKKKSDQLGMPFGTASARLRKIILFSLLKKHNENICYRCNKLIETINELTIDHKEPWLDKDINLFWDINNIAFSHHNCNVSIARKLEKKVLVHGTRHGYARWNCRCQLCKNGQAEFVRKFRAKK